MTNIRWHWIGGVTASDAIIKAKTDDNTNNLRVIYVAESNLRDLQESSPFVADSSNNLVARCELKNLQADTRYYYTLEADGNSYGKISSFKTFKINESYNFGIGFGACAGGGDHNPDQVSNSGVFDIIRNYEYPPLSLFIHMGDFHYRNIDVADLTKYQEAYNDVLSQPRQRQLYQNVPIAYVWDDHDYGPNNSDRTSAGKLVAREAYRQQVPHYPLAEPENNGAIYQSFIIGRVRFIMTDNRSCRSPYQDDDNSTKTVLGDKQKEWFFRELETGRDEQELIVWVNTFPWIGDSGDDGWHRYTTERREIATFIKNNNINSQLLMIAGDAHMIALDDGRNNQYASGGGGSFPVVHAAALDSTPSEKGGPYSEGAQRGTSQWGVLKFTDDGSKIEVEVKLKRNHDTRIRKFFSF